MILIDSDILIWILRNNPEYKDKFNKIVQEYKGKIYITPIQYVEIMAGVKEKEKINTEVFLDSLGIIVIGVIGVRLALMYLIEWELQMRKPDPNPAAMVDTGKTWDRL